MFFYKEQHHLGMGRGAWVFFFFVFTSLVSTGNIFLFPRPERNCGQVDIKVNTGGGGDGEAPVLY